MFSFRRLPLEVTAMAVRLHPSTAAVAAAESEVTAKAAETPRGARSKCTNTNR